VQVYEECHSVVHDIQSKAEEGLCVAFDTVEHLSQGLLDAAAANLKN